jgi:Bacterial pre-peptidase C-terminal domain
MLFNTGVAYGDLIRCIRGSRWPSRRPSRRKNSWCTLQRLCAVDVLEDRLLLSGESLADPISLEPLFVNMNGSTDTTVSQPAYAVVDGSTTPQTAGPVAEVESNDSPATAQSLDGETFSLAFDANIGDSTTIPHLTIEGTGDGTFDYYSFTVENAGDSGTFDIDFGNTGGAGSIDTVLFLYDTSGNLLLWVDDSAIGDGGDGSTSGYDSLLRYTFDSAGTYVIGVGKNPSFPGAGEIAGTPPGAGDTYTLQVSLEGKTATSSSETVYSFDLQAGESATVVTELLSAGSVNVELQDASGNTVASGDALHNYVASTSGTYFVVVSGDGADYRLVVARNADVDTEPNNDLLSSQQVLSTQVDGGLWVLGNLSSSEVSGVVAEVESNDSLAGAQDLDDAVWSLADDPNIDQSSSVPHVSVQGTGDGTFDYYSFTVSNAGDVGTFDIDFGSNPGGAGDMDTVIFLYDSNGTLLATNDDSMTSSVDGGSLSSWDSFLQYTFDAPGTYVIAVGEYFSEDGGGQLTGNPPDAGDTYTLQVSIENHAVATPSDWYQVQLGENQRLTVDTSSVAGSGFDAMVRVYDSAGNLVASDDNSGADGRNAHLSYDVPLGAAGTYYVEVVASTATADPTEGDYVLSIKHEDLGGGTGDGNGDDDPHTRFTRRSDVADEHCNRPLNGVHALLLSAGDVVVARGHSSDDDHGFGHVDHEHESRRGGQGNALPPQAADRAFDRVFVNGLDFLLTSV